MEVKYFTPEEMTCKCGCNSCRMEPSFMEKLERMRSAYFRKPMIVTSAFRCVKHDKSVGGKGNHPLGLAADILVNKGEDMAQFLNAIFAVNIRRVVLYHKLPHVHIDDNPDLPGGIFIY